MNNLIKIITSAIFFVGVSHNAFADFTSYELTLYSPESWTGSGDEYAGTNFWSHRYWNSTTDRDECNSRGCQFNTDTHSGIDYRVSDNNNKIYSFGFGKIIRKRTAYGQVSIRHLVNTGDYFIANLLHSSGIDSAISENNYIAKKQFVGIKDGIGAGGTVAFAEHLHFEVSDSENLSIPLTDNAHPGPGDLRPSDPALAKGGLIAHYVGTNPAIRYFNPNIFADTKREAIPFLSRIAMPTESSYDVYGIANKTIYGHLDLTGTFHRSSIVVRDFFSRSQVENQGGLDDTHRFLGGVNFDSQVNGIEGENIYQEGDYLFVAYVNDNDEHRFGYPIKFSFVPEGSIIVDNDQQNADSDSGNDSGTEPAYNGSVGSKVPGYFLTADLHTGRSGAFAQWKPYQSGRYEIYVHIPEYGATATNVIFKVLSDGQNSVYAEGINMANYPGQWVQITNGDKKNFDFTDKGYVGISLSNDPSSSNYHIDESQKVSFDAVKFKKVGTVTTERLSFFPIVLSGKFFLIPAKKNDAQTFNTVTSLTGRVWMDRNLGASRAATSMTDEQAYGDLYQWGRLADGHQKRTSDITATLSSTDVPGHSNFIISTSSPNDWRNPPNDNLWQGLNGINNPCPNGFRVPTADEWRAEINSWSSKDAAGAFASPLKMVLAGSRSFYYGTLKTPGEVGIYWSSTADGSYVLLGTDVAEVTTVMNPIHAQGESIRCIKD